MKNIFRRKYLINPSFQLPFVTRMVVINIIMTCLLYIGIYIIFYRFNFLGNELGLESTHRFYKFIDEQFVLITTVFVAAGVASSLVLAVYSFFLSHRIVGPLENLKIRFKRLENESPDECKTRFRKDDFFHDLAVAYNEHLEKNVNNKKE